MSRRIAPRETRESQNSRICNETRSKTAAIVLTVAMLVVALASSCTTTTTFNGSQEECDYALHYVLDKANESTLSKLFFRITETQTFISDDLSFILQHADEIPGIRKLLDEWTQSMSRYTLDWFEGFTTYTTSLAKGLRFDDPQKMVLESDFSAALTMESVYGESILSYVKTTLKGADLTKWDEVAAQYNAWTKTRMAMYGEENPSLGEVDIVDDMAAYISMLYFEDLKASETLLRTTPDPNADPTVTKVFGLD